MKEDFIRALAEGMEIHSEDIKVSDDMKTILKKVYQSNVQMLSDTLVWQMTKIMKKHWMLFLKPERYISSVLEMPLQYVSWHTEIWKIGDSVFRT